PLQQTIVVLWAIGCWHLAARFLEGMIGWVWVCSAGLGTLGATIGAGYFRLQWLLPAAVVLGVGAWLAAAFERRTSYLPDFGVSRVLYSFLVWGLSIVLLKHPQPSRLASLLHLGVKRSILEVSVHWTTVVISLLCVAIPLALVSVFTPSVGLFCTF